MTTETLEKPDTDGGSDAVNPGEQHQADLVSGSKRGATGGSEGAGQAAESGGVAGVAAGLSDTLNKGYTGPMGLAGPAGMGVGIASRLIGLRNRKGAAGGVAGLIITVMVILGGIGAGPLEFVHLSHLLHDAHLGSQENAGDSRVGKIFRFSRTGRPGETRLGLLGSKYHAKIISDLESIGITPEYKGADFYKGMSYDINNPSSPYHGMTAEDAAAAIEQKTGLKPTINGNKLTVDADKFWTQRKSLSGALGDLKLSKVTTVIRGRVLAKFGLVSFHPMKAADKALYEKATDPFKKWKAARDDRIRNGQPANPVDPSKATEAKETVDSKGNKVITQQPLPDNSPAFTPAVEPSQSALQQIANSKSLKITGGLAAGVGLVCLIRQVDDNVAHIRFVQVITPLIRLGGEALATGAQIEAHTDENIQVMGFMKQLLNSPATKTQPASNYNSGTAYAVSAAKESPNGTTDIDKNTKDMITKQRIDSLDWTQKPAMQDLCSTYGQVAVGAVSVVVSVISGGIISNVVGFVTQSLLLGHVIDFISNMLAGNAIDLAKAGAQYGNYIDYGVTLMANSSSVVFGAIGLSPKQAAEVNNATYQAQQEQFASRSVFDRMFDIHDYHSFSSHVIDGVNGNSNVASILTRFSSLGSTLFRLPAMLFGAQVHAAPTATYDYGFPQYGFSEADLNSPLVSDPYANADAAAAILDADTSGTYKNRAMECFGIKLDKANGMWDAIPDHTVDMYDPATYDPTKCASTGDQNWLRIRFFIFDTGIMAGYACYTDGDQESCAQSGIGSSGSSSAAGTGQSSSQPVGNIGDPSADVLCAPNTKDLGVTTSGYTGDLTQQKGTLQIRLCQLSSITGAGQDTKGNRTSDGAVVNSRVSGAWQALGEAAKTSGVSLSANSSFRLGDSCGGSGNGKSCATPGGSMHQLGAAIDFNLPHIIDENAQTCAVRKRAPGDPSWDWLNNHAAQFGFKQYSAEAWHWDNSPLPNRCGGDGS
ncbi:MAG: hypothetical protein JWO41_147 [Candidatus Saccharibacteria bacterium]|nr:hypothetical protein [Candidatus Saccharibacteria bacterium]